MAKGQPGERYRLLVERSPYCIHEIDLDARLLSMNPAGLAMVGAEREADVIGRPYLEIVGERDRTRVEDLRRRALQGEASQFEFEALNGRIFASSFVPILGAGGQVIRLMGITHDVTEQRHLEAQLRQSQKLESIGELAGGIAHDFNNILQVILGELDVAKARIAQGRSPLAALDSIEHAATRAADLTERLLTMGRRQPIHLVPTDLNALLEAQARILARMLPETIEVNFRGEPNLPPVKVDRHQIEEVVLNLSVNASHAMPSGGTLDIGTQLVSQGRAGRVVGVYLRDSGAGMTPQVAERAFEPFFTTKPVGKGTGLGLSVVYGIVKQHGGEISLTSEPGRGTCVTMELPVSDEPAAVEESTVPAAGPASGETILVAEDDDLVRELVCSMLSHAGYTVLEAEDGERAVEQLAAHPEIAAAVLDVVMPRMNGVEVCEVILARYPHVRVLFSGGYSSDTLPQSYLEQRTLRILRKPYQAPQLLAAVRSLLAV